MLSLLGLVMITLYCETTLMRHYHERVKVSAIRSCPLYKPVFRCFGPLSLKSPTNNFLLLVLFLRCSLKTVFSIFNRYLEKMFILRTLRTVRYIYFKDTKNCPLHII